LHRVDVGNRALTDVSEPVIDLELADKESNAIIVVRAERNPPRTIPDIPVEIMLDIDYL
jgi:hypothetical protein